MNTPLDAIQESFEDVSLDYTAKPSKFYGINRQRSFANFSSSSTLIRKSYSTNSLAKTTTSKETLLTASQKLRLLKKQRALQLQNQRGEDQLAENSPENLNTIDFLSDDELPDNLIVFDVPSLHSLHSHSTNKSRTRKSPLRRQNSVSSNHSNNSANGSTVSNTDSPTSLNFQSFNASAKETSITNTHNISQQIDRSNQNSILAHVNTVAKEIANVQPIYSYSTPSLHSAPPTIPGSAYPLAQSHFHTRSKTNSTLSSPATRASSIFSKSSDVSEFRCSEDDILSPMSKDVKMLSDFKDRKLEETLQRMSMLKSMSHVVTQPDIALPNDSLNNHTKSTSTIRSLPTEKVKELTKEKQSYLTSTRQSNLPPKTKYETLKHERDLQNILESEIHSESQKIKEYEHKRIAKLKQNEKDKKSWSKVIKNYDTLIKLPQTRELWWRNVPQSYRSRIWAKQLTSTKRSLCDDEKLESTIKESIEMINEACNFKLVNDAQQRKQLELKNLEIVSSVKFIEECSTRLQHAFPNLMMFQYGENFDLVLTVLLSFEKLRQKHECIKNIHTLQLVDLVCVLFYVFRDGKITLSCLLTLVQKKLPNIMLSSNKGQIPDTLTEDLKLENNEELQSSFLKDIKDQFDKYLLSLAPSLYNHFIQRDVNSLKVVQCLTGTIFADQLDLEVVLRIMDLYLFEGDILLLRASLALLKKVSYKLFGDREEIYEILNANNKEDDINENEEEDHDTSTIVSSKPGLHERLDVGDVDNFINDIRGVLKKTKGNKN